MRILQIALCLCFASILVPISHAEPTEASRLQFQEIKLRAEKGDPAAQNDVGLAYSGGQGVEADPAEAVKWFQKAAAKNHPKAKFNLGVCYRDGLGVEKDEAEAIKWLTDAAKQNLPEAQYTLGNWYMDGIRGSPNYPEGVKWLRKAAEQNFAPAQNNLGFCYFNGQGVEKDLAEAYAWYNLASTSIPTARNNRDAVEATMSAPEIAKAQKRSRELRAKIDGKTKPGNK